MVSHFDNQKKEILDLINDETRFKQTCFPSALELEKSLQEIKEAIEKTQAYDQEFEKRIKAGKDLIKGEDFIEVEPKRGMNHDPICVKIPNAPTPKRLLVFD